MLEELVNVLLNQTVGTDHTHLILQFLDGTHTRFVRILLLHEKDHKFIQHLGSVSGTHGRHFFVVVLFLMQH